MSASCGTSGRTSSSSPIRPFSTSCIAHVAVAILVIDATRVKESGVNLGASGEELVRPAEP